MLTGATILRPSMSIRALAVDFAALREREFARLDDGGHAYLDYTGSALYPDRLVAAHATALRGSSEPVRAARWHHARARAHHNQLARLRRGLDGVPCTTLPRLHVTEVDTARLEELAGRLERVL